VTWLGENNNNEGTSDLGMDRDQQYRVTLKLEGKADQTAMDGSSKTLRG